MVRYMCFKGWEINFIEGIIILMKFLGIYGIGYGKIFFLIMDKLMYFVIFIVKKEEYV